jgi:hypothetical protein
VESIFPVEFEGLYLLQRTSDQQSRKVYVDTSENIRALDFNLKDKRQLLNHRIINNDPIRSIIVLVKALQKMDSNFDSSFLISKCGQHGHIYAFDDLIHTYDYFPYAVDENGLNALQNACKFKMYGFITYLLAQNSTFVDTNKFLYSENSGSILHFIVENDLRDPNLFELFSPTTSSVIIAYENPVGLFSHKDFMKSL